MAIKLTNQEARRIFDEMTSSYHDSKATIGVHRKIVVCDNCKGTGHEFVRGHGGHYSVDDSYVTCRNCRGDGRWVEEKTSITYPTLERTKKIKVSDTDVYYHDDSHSFQTMRDQRNAYLEKKYPELEALTYKRYHDKLQEIMVIETLKKE